MPASIFSIVIWFSIYALMSYQFYRLYMGTREVFAKYCFHAYCLSAGLCMFLILALTYGLYVSGMAFAVTSIISIIALGVYTSGHIRVSEIRQIKAHQ